LGTVVDLFTVGDESASEEAYEKALASLIKQNENIRNINKRLDETGSKKPRLKELDETILKEIDPFDAVLDQMIENDGIQGAAKEAALHIKSMDIREKSSHMSTLSKALDWINDPHIRAMITRNSTFDLRTCKTRNDTVCLNIEKRFIEEQSRFIRVFYTLALDVLDEEVTPQPFGSKRRVLMIFDEFEALGHFAPVRNAILRSRSDYVKIWIVLQNIGQLFNNYENEDDFLGNCDQQYFGITSTETRANELLQRALGKYNDPNGSNGDYTEKNLVNSRSLSKILQVKSGMQIFIPYAESTKIMRLNRIPWEENFENFWKRILNKFSKWF